MELCQGRGRWGIGKGSSPEGDGALEQAAHGRRHGPKQLEFKKHLNTALRHIVSFLGDPRGQGLDAVSTETEGKLSIFLVRFTNFPSSLQSKRQL